MRPKEVFHKALDMELVIQARKLEIPEETRAYIEKKMTRLGRHLPMITSAKVELEATASKSPQHRVVAQITVNCNGALLRGEERSSTVLAAVDAATQVMERQVRRFKGRAYQSERAKRAGENASVRTIELPQEPPAPGIDLGKGRLVRVKRFPMKPMTLEEAAHQMELLGHDFFLFYNSATHQYNVLYRRRAGDYGVIQPELS